MTPPEHAGIALAALALACAAPAFASRPVGDPPASAEEGNGTLARAVELFKAQDCAGALALLDPLAPRLAPGSERTGVQLMRLRCLAAAGRIGEVAPLQRELASSAPRDPAVRSIGVLVSVDARRFGEAADQIRAIATDQPAVLALIPGTLWRAVAQRLTESGDIERRGKAIVALARADWQPVDRPEMRDEIAQGAIEVLLGEHDVAGAGALLPRVSVPELLTSMAMERRYQPLWPAIEARLGPHGGKAIDGFAAARLDAFANSPADPRARRDAIRAFILLGRLDDAIVVGDQVTVADGLDEDDADAVRFAAEAVAAKGDRQKAADRLRTLAALDPDRTPEAVSAAVTLAEMLDEGGRPEDAFKAAQDGIARGEKALSPWGLAWLRRTELCALVTLGRSVEARAAGDRLLAAAQDNEPAAIEGLLCAGRVGEAAAIAVRTLATSEGAGRLADQFQPQGAFWAARPSRLRDLWAPLLARKDVRAAFDRSARILPRTLWPSAQPRPLPRSSAGSGFGPTT